MALSKVDKAIAVINYESKFFKNEIAEFNTRTQVSEAGKIRVQRMDNLLRSVDVLVKEAKSNVEAILGKLPAQAIELEESVLGAIMLDKADGLPMVESYLKPEHFYKEAHREIYKSILKLRAAKEPIDMRTVVYQLRVDGTIDQIGGAYYIAEITSKVASAANIDYHARVVVEMAIKRQLALVAQKLMLDAYDDTADCFVMLDVAATQIKTAQEWIKP